MDCMDHGKRELGVDGGRSHQKGKKGWDACSVNDGGCLSQRLDRVENTFGKDFRKKRPDMFFIFDGPVKCQGGKGWIELQWVGVAWAKQIKGVSLLLSSLLWENLLFFRVSFHF